MYWFVTQPVVSPAGSAPSSQFVRLALEQVHQNIGRRVTLMEWTVHYFDKRSGTDAVS